jgi:hypothetical protein
LTLPLGDVVGFEEGTRDRDGITLGGLLGVEDKDGVMLGI